MKKLFKYISYLAAGLVGLLILAAAFTQTPIFKGWLKSKLISLAESNLDAQITIAELNGNLFDFIAMEDVVIQQQSDSLLVINKLFIDYNLTQVLAKRISVDWIVIERPQVEIRKKADGTWNVSDMLKSSPQSPETDTEAAGDTSGFGWTIVLDHLEIRSGSIDLYGLSSDEPNFPEKIDSLNMAFGFQYDEENLAFDLRELTFLTHSPALELQEAEAEVDLSGDKLRAEETGVTTGRSTIKSNITVQNRKDPKLDISFEAKPLALSELRAVLGDFFVYGRPQINLKAQGPLSDLKVRLDIAIAGGEIQLDSDLNLKNEPYRYDISGQFTDIDLAAIMQRPELESDLTFDINLEGKGTEWGDVTATYNVSVDTGYAMGRHFEGIILNGEVVEDSLHLSADLRALGSRATFDGYFATAEADTTYELQGNFEQLNLSDVMADSGMLVSNLNLDFELSGRGLTPQQMDAEFEVDVSSSTIADSKIDTANIKFAIRNQVFRFERFWVSSEMAEITARGAVGFEKRGEISFDATFQDLAKLRAFLPVDTLSGESEVTGRVSGTLDSLRVETDIDAQKVFVQDITIPEFHGSLNAKLGESGRTFDLTGEALDVRVAGFEVTRTDFALSMADSVVDYDITVQQADRFSAETKGDFIFLSDGFRLVLQDLGFEILAQEWRKPMGDVAVRKQGEAFSVERLILTSDGQEIILFGELDPESAADITVRINNLDLAKVAQLFDPNETELEGRLHSEVIITGTLTKPVIDGQFGLADGRYYEEKFRRFSGNLEYANGQFDWDWALSETGNDTLFQNSGFVPLELSLMPFQTTFLDNKPLQFEFSTAGMNLSFIRYFVANAKKIDGTLVADFKIYNTLQDLRGQGPIEIRDGEADIPQLGTEYRDIDFIIELQDKEVAIKKLEIQSEGRLKFIEGSLSLSKQAIENYSAKLRADNFEIMDNEKANLDVSGTIELSGDVRGLQAQGNLTVVNAVIYYEQWMQEDTAVELTGRPYFVVAPDSVGFNPRGAIRFQETETEIRKPFTETQFYKNLRINLALIFKRNTWLRSGEANVEVEGNLDLIKESEGFVLFGSLSSVRGFYELQGNRFEIERGDLNFQGNPDINPFIDVEAVYDFRNPTESGFQEQEITVIITGTKENPKFRFLIDGQEADQKDVVSILLFGQPFDSLPIGQRSNVAGQTESNGGLGEKATGFLTGQVLKQLSSRLGSELKLDVLQVESGEDLADTKLRVGKYITDDIYVSVSQDFGADGEQSVKLEYELPRDIFFLNLFLQALQERKGNSAVDVIWKFEW